MWNCFPGNVIPWAKVAASLPNRTDSSCLVRWRILSSSDDLAKYHKSVKMNAKLKQSNNNGLKLSVSVILAATVCIHA